jgi:hypothetical protein
MTSTQFALTITAAIFTLSFPCPAGGAVDLCELGKVVSEGMLPSDYFGVCVAISDGLLFVGAVSEDGQYEKQGAVHIFGRVGDTWVEQQLIEAPEPSARLFFGGSLDADNGVLAVRASPYGGLWQLYVFEEGPLGYELTATFTTGVEGDYFASSISVNGDTVVAGAHRDDDIDYDAGAVYVFVKDGEEWAQQAKLTASDGDVTDYFGGDVWLDGDRLAVGASGDDLPGGTDAGSAYIFSRSGTAWSEEAKVTASDGVTWDYFGSAVAVEGDTLLVSAPEDIHGPEEQGSVYVFERSGSVWTEQMKLGISDGVMGDGLGYDIVIDGDEAAVSIRQLSTESPYCYGTYFYSRAGGSWAEAASLGSGISWGDLGPGRAIALAEGYLAASTFDDYGSYGGTGVMVYTVGQGPCAPMLAVSPGPDPAAPTEVRGFDVAGHACAETGFDAYPLYEGYGVRVAAGDLDGDGYDELVTGPGPARFHPTLLRAFSRYGFKIEEVENSAYGVNRYGLNVACGDLDGDGYDEIVTGPGPGEVFGPQVRGWNVDDGETAPMAGVNFFAYGTLKYGVNVGCGDVDGDGFDEIVTGAGPGAVFGPHVRGWNVDGGTAAPIAGISFFAYGTLKWGVNVCCADLDGDGIDEIVTGAGPGAVFGPHVRGWNYDGGQLAAIPAVSFLAYGTNRFGVRVAGGDLDRDGYGEIVTTPGPGDLFGAHVRGWNYDGQAVSAIGTLNFFAFESSLRYGADVAVVRR